jgi:CRISPR-associated protein Csb2
MGAYGRQNQGSVSGVFSGKDPTTGSPVADHRHAHFLPTDEDGDGFIDHLTIYSDAGLGTLELKALEALRLLTVGTELKRQIRLTPVDEAPSLLGPALRWKSHLPFAPIRHPKRKQGRLQDGPLDQIRLELSRRGLPVPETVRLIDSGAPTPFDLLEGPHLARGPRYFAEITFPRAVTGPIAIGAASHFGMGLFLPSDSTQLKEGGNDPSS